MRSQVGQAPYPHWKKRITFDTSGPFWVQWIATGFVGFQQVTHIENPYLGYQSATFGKDCQEIERQAGAELCDYLDQHMRAWHPEK
jgi:hypothetical protein